jgi:uncharacterized SAM-binding protein YcdF (DUF218 family)
MYPFFVALLNPFTLLFLFLLLTVANLWRWRVESRRRLLLVTVPLVGLAILTTPIASYWAALSLEWPYPPIEHVPADSQAIVVLGGGIREPTSTRPQAELAEDTRDRCIYAAELYKQRPLPMVVTGGIVNTDIDVPPLAEAMKTLLVSLGVPADEITLEDRSRSTYENAAFTHERLAEKNIERIVLVTEADHMLRASKCFSAQGFGITPAACRHSIETFRLVPQSFLPNADAAEGVAESMHEWLGIVWYKLSGKM